MRDDETPFTPRPTTPVCGARNAVRVGVTRPPGALAAVEKGQPCEPIGVWPARMNRVLALLLALLIPMQSAWSAIGPIASRVDAGCAQSLSMAVHQDHAGTQVAGVPDCDCGGLPHTGVHTFVHHHGCAHFGVAMVTVATAAASPPASAGAAPDSKHASFESVVLDVPSPPPTTGA